MNRERAETVTDLFRGKRILVLGDIMLDEFIWGRVRRISPEAPVPIVEVTKQTLAPGGASNVVSNLASLGAEATPVGIIGDDDNADRLRKVFRNLSVNLDRLVIDDSRPTTVKTRIIAHNQQVVRADKESRTPIDSKIEDLIVRSFVEASRAADGVVVSDYGKGLLTANVVSRTLAAARERNLIVCVDPKMRTFDRYQPVTVITPNNQEAGDAAGIEIVDERSLTEAGTKLLGSLDCSAVLITRGEEGMTLFTGESVTHIPTVAREVFDVTGAGDTVIATLALALTAGASLEEAAVLANHAAGVVVAKLGTATVSRDELLASF